MPFTETSVWIFAGGFSGSLLFCLLPFCDSLRGDEEELPVILLVHQLAIMPSVFESFIFVVVCDAFWQFFLYHIEDFVLVVYSVGWHVCEPSYALFVGSECVVYVDLVEFDFHIFDLTVLSRAVD